MSEISGYTKNLNLVLYKNKAKNWDSGVNNNFIAIDQKITDAYDSHNIDGYNSDNVYDNLVDIFDNLTSLNAASMPYRKLRTLMQPFGFYGNVEPVGTSNITQIIIKPKVSPYGKFIGAILNDGEYLESATAITIKYDTPANSGHILNGIGKVANSFQILRPYKDVSGNLAFGFDWIPITTFTDANPTNTLTLAQVDGKDVGLCFAEGAELVVFDASTKFQTPCFYSGGSYDATAELYTASRTGSVLTLNKNLSISSLAGGKIVYAVSGFKPIDYSTGNITSLIGIRGYSDTGIVLKTDASSYLVNFSETDDMVIFLDDTDSIFDVVSSYNARKVHRLSYVPPHKKALFGYITYDAQGGLTGATITIYTSPYYSTTVKSQIGYKYEANADMVTNSLIELPILHGLIGFWSLDSAVAGTGRLYTKGYYK